MLSLQKNIGFAAVLGALAGALFALVFKGYGISPIGFLLSPIPMAVAGLAFGHIGLATACIVGMAILCSLAGVSGAVFYVVWDVIPVAVTVSLLLKNRKVEDDKTVCYPVGYALSWTSIITATIAILVSIELFLAYNISLIDYESVEMTKEEAIASVTQNFWENGSLHDTATKILTEAVKLPATVNIPGYQETLQYIAYIFMALMAIAWFFRIIVAIFLAEHVLTKAGKALRPNPEYIPLYIQNWLLTLVIVTGLIAQFASSENVRYVAANFAVAVSVPFCMLGLSQIHTWARSVPFTKAILFAFYTFSLLVAFIGIGLIGFLGILAIIGLYEQLARIYRRYVRPVENGEK